MIPPPHSDKPLLQPFLTMKQQSLESEGKNKLFWKLKEEHQSLCDKFAQLENGKDVIEKNVETARSWKNEYDELIEKFNSVSDEFVAKNILLQVAQGCLQILAANVRLSMRRWMLF